MMRCDDVRDTVDFYRPTRANPILIAFNFEGRLLGNFDYLPEVRWLRIQVLIEVQVQENERNY